MTFRLKEDNLTYDKDKIHVLFHQYLKTRDDSILNELLEAVQDIIQIQLGKNYQSMKASWDSMKCDCIMRLWESLKTNPEQVTKSQEIDQFFWQRIRANLDWQKELEKLLEEDTHEAPEGEEVEDIEEPLFDSTRSYMEQNEYYQEHKKGRR